MKTSNYIIIAFFTFLFGGIFTLFLTAKIDPRGSQHRELQTIEKPLDSFSVIVAQPGSNIRLVTGTAPQISIEYQKGDTCTLPAFNVQNDTLFVGENPKKNKYWATKVSCIQINSIVGNDKSEIVLEHVQSDTLLVKLNKGNFRYYSGNNKPSNSLRLIAYHSYIQLRDASINNLNLQLKHTEMDAWNNNIKNLSGKLTEESDLSLNQIRKINLETDSTSTYRLNK